MKKIFKNKKSIILILLSLILIFNFITIPQKAEAIAFTLGGIAITYKVAEAIYLFVLASAAVGVTYATWEEAKNVYEIYEGTSPGPLDNPEWQEKADEVKQSKADIASDYWFDQWELEDIPGGGSDPDPGNDNKRSILGLIGGAGIMSVVLNKFKDLFRTLDIEEGENLISEDLVTQMKRDNVLFEIIRSPNGSAVMLYINGVKVSTSSSLSPNQLYGKLISVSKTDVDYIINWKVRMYNPETGIWDPFSDRETIKKISSVPNLYPDGVPPIEGPKGHNFTVKPNSPVLDSGPYLRKPQQPNLIPIRRIQPTILPDGSKEIVYKEGIDELIKDVVLNTPIDKILNPEPYPYSIVPGDNGEVIIKPEIDPTVPYPDPLPAPDIPYPDPSLPPGINPGEYPGPGPYPWLPPLPEPGIEPGQYPGPGPYPDLPGYPDPDLPPGINPGEYPGPGPYPGIDPPPEPGIEPGQYPGPGPYPFPDPNAPPMTEVDPGFMINYIPWLKVIINWLSMIWHKIPWIPEVDPEEEIIIDPDPDPGEEPGLILPSDEFLQEKLLDLEAQIKEKLGIPDLQPIGDMFGGIYCMPLEDKSAKVLIMGGDKSILSDVDIVLVDKINDLAPEIANLQRILWWTIIILMSLNNGYKLIRGTDLITIKGPGGKGNHYKGS